MATGNIVRVINTLEFDTDGCASLDIIHIAGNVYLIAYRGGVGPDGILKTVTIESDGSIGSVIATRIFEATWGYMPSLAHISGDVYIVGYRGPGNDGWLKTFTVDSSGNIGAVFNSKEIDPVYGRNFRFYHLGGTVWLVVYQDASVGWLKTININSNGTFGADIGSQRYDFILGAFPALIHIAGDIFAIAYTGEDEDGWLKTWEIQSDGTIAAARTDEFEFSTTYGHWPQILHISGDVYAIAYQGPPSGVDGWGYIKTLTISSAGVIGGPVRIFQYTPQRARGVSAIIHIAEEVYTLVYTGPLDDGYIVTVTIHNDGQIDDPLVGKLEFDPDNAVTCEMVKIAVGIYAIAYSGVDDDGFLRTIEIVEFATPTVTTDPATEVT